MVGNEFENAVIRLKLSAIDAFMRGPGGDGRGKSQVVQDPDFPTESYYINLRGRYTVPDEDGERGGLRVEDSLLFGKKLEPSWASDKFDGIRTWIEEIVDRWRDTPDPGRIEDLVSRFGEVELIFGCRSTEPGGNTILTEHVFYRLTNIYRAVFDDDLDGVRGDAEGLQGQGFDRFRNYFQSLVDAASACYEVVQVIGGAVKTEKELWDAVPAGVIWTINEMADACDTVAAGGAAQVDVDVLSVLALGFGVVSCVPSPVQLPAGIASVGLSAVTTVNGLGGEGFRAIDYVRPTPGPIPSYSGAIEVLSLLLNGSVAGVDQQVTATEEAVWDTLSGAIAEIYSPSRGRRFDPVAGTITDAIRTDPARASTIVEEMNALTRLLDNAVRRIQDCLDLPADTMRRHERIGTGLDGPYPRIVELLELLRQLLRELSDEAYAAAENFRVSQEVLYLAEHEAQERLRQAARNFRDADAITSIEAERLRRSLVGAPRLPSVGGFRF